MVHAETTASTLCTPEAGAFSAEAASEIQADCCEVRQYATVPRWHAGCLHWLQRQGQWQAEVFS